MAIIRWNPFQELHVMQDAINKLFDETFSSRYPKKHAEEGSVFSPLVDIYETKEEIRMDIELPGMKLEDIRVNIEEDSLNIEGERKDETVQKDRNYHRVERVYGKFSRSFNLPSNIDKEKINANFKEGVLKITLPKKESVKPKQIAISVDKK